VTGEQRAYAKQEQEPATDEITELAPGVLRTQLPVQLPGLGHVNCYLLEDERGVALIDPGLPGPESWDALLDRLRRAGFQLRHVHTAIITHSHFDHFGGAPRLQAEGNGVDVLTHDSFRLVFDEREMFENPDAEALELNEAEDIERLREVFRRPKPWGGHWSPPPDDELRMFARLGRRTRRFAIPAPTVTVADSEVIRLARREWVAVHTPGHTTDHLCLYDPEHKLFVSGDHVLPTITPHIAGAGPVGADDRDPLARFFESLRRMHDFDVDLVLPAHGHPFTDLAGRADQIVHHHHERLDVIREAAGDLPLGTVADYMRRLFRERSWGDMAESETYAHLEHLRLLGEAITSTRDDGQLVYELTA
jgi:glyoxylase-like metal-dependent hydrolase (beta-lactamase superfamily II)